MDVSNENNLKRVFNEWRVRIRC